MSRSKTWSPQASRSSASGWSEDWRQVFGQLDRGNVILRPVDGYGLPDYVSVSVGAQSGGSRFLTALEKVLAARRASRSLYVDHRSRHRKQLDRLQRGYRPSVSGRYG